MTASVTVSERDLCILLGIVRDHRDDLPDAGVPLSLLAELVGQVRCDNVSVFSANYRTELLDCSFMQELPPVDISGLDESASDGCHWPEFSCYPDRSGDLRSVTKVSDFYSARQWHSTIPHTDFFRPLGFEHVLQLCLPGRLGPAAWPQSAAKMMFFRSPGPDFSERDRDLLALLQPHLYRTYLDAERRRRGTPRLTPRQREVLRLIAAGHTNAQIARRLGITEGTVRSHLESIYSRRQVSSRPAAVACALRDETAV